MNALWKETADFSQDFNNLAEVYEYFNLVIGKHIFNDTFLL